MNTTTYLALRKLFDQSIGDSLEFSTTVDIAANNVIKSTELNPYDDGVDGYFDMFWVTVETGNNVDLKRKTGLPVAGTTYATSTGQLTLPGAALTAETASVTCRLHQYNPTDKNSALTEAIKEVYPALSKSIDDMTLITGNIPPDGHMEYWSSSTAMSWWSTTNCSVAQASAAGSTRGGTYAAKATNSAASGYVSLNSNAYPRLLNLQDKTVNAYAYALPETADEPAIVITTKDKAGSTQTLASTTTAQAGEFTQIKLENQKINPNLTDIEIRLRTAGSATYTVWDDVYLGSDRQVEYLMPDSLVLGSLDEVRIQTATRSDEAMYDPHPFITYPGANVSFKTFNDGTNVYFRLLESVPAERRMRLIGKKPLETLTSTTDTLTLEADKIPALIAKARMIFWSRLTTPISKGDKDKAVDEYNKAARDFYRLSYKQMNQGSVKIKSDTY